MVINYNEDKALLRIITEDGRVKLYHPVPIVRYWQFMTLRKNKIYGKAWQVISPYRQDKDFMPF